MECGLSFYSTLNKTKDPNPVLIPHIYTTQTVLRRLWQLYETTFT